MVVVRIQLLFLLSANKVVNGRVLGSGRRIHCTKALKRLIVQSALQIESYHEKSFFVSEINLQNGLLYFKGTLPFFLVIIYHFDVIHYCTSIALYSIITMSVGRQVSTER